MAPLDDNSDDGDAAAGSEEEDNSDASSDGVPMCRMNADGRIANTRRRAQGPNDDI